MTYLNLSSLFINFSIMRISIITGHLGADAVCQSSNGFEFVSCRVGVSRRFKDSQGVSHEVTDWVDCLFRGRPAVLPYLLKGTHVLIVGDETLRVYSSQKDRCMKAGATLNVLRCELLSNKSNSTSNESSKTSIPLTGPDAAFV